MASGARCTLYLGGDVTESRAALASRLGVATGTKVFCSTWAPRQESGAGRAPIARLQYFGEMAAAQLEGTEHLIVIGGRPPITFFAYPDKPNELTPKGATVHQICDITDDIDTALATLVDAAGAGHAAPKVLEVDRPSLPDGDLDPAAVGRSLAHHLPEHAIVVNEAGTAGGGYQGALRGTPPFSLLALTGGSTGYGLPAATGAAVACADRQVFAMQADGAGMYTVQALWTQVREGLDVTNIIFNNGKYAILQFEFERVGAHAPGPKAMSMLDLENPALDWVSLARGMGMAGSRATTAAAFNAAIAESIATPGPSLIEVVI